MSGESGEFSRTLMVQQSSQAWDRTHNLRISPVVALAQFQRHDWLLHMNQMIT